MTEHRHIKSPVELFPLRNPCWSGRSHHCSCSVVPAGAAFCQQMSPFPLFYHKGGLSEWMQWTLNWWCECFLSDWLGVVKVKCHHDVVKLDLKWWKLDFKLNSAHKLHKRPRGLKYELIRFWWSKVKGHCDLTNTFLAITQEFIC